MELKYRNGSVTISRQGSFNRTFMELKFGKEHRFKISVIVLIVPLWN